MAIKVYDEKVTFSDKKFNALKKKALILMEGSFNMFKNYQNVLNDDVLKIESAVSVNDEMYHIVTDLNKNSNTVSCAVSYNGIQYKMCANMVDEKIQVPEQVLVEDKTTEKKEDDNDNNVEYSRYADIPADVKTSVCNDIKAGMSDKVIMNKWHISSYFLYKVKHEFDVVSAVFSSKIPYYNRVMNHFDVIIEDLAKGEMSLKEVGAKFNIPEWAIQKVKFSYQGKIDEVRQKLQQELNGPRDRHNLEVSKQPKYQRPNADLESKIIEDLIAGNLNSIEIAAKYGTNSSVIDQIEMFNRDIIARGKNAIKAPKIPSNFEMEGDKEASDDDLKKLVNHFKK